MADIDSSEIFGGASDNNAFSQAKSFQNPSQSLGQNPISSDPTFPASENNFVDQSLSEQQPATESSDLVKFFYDLAPFLKPNPTDPEETKMKKQQQIARFQSLSQEMQQITLQKMQTWQQRKAQLAQEAETKKAAEQQFQNQTIAAPSGRRQGAQAAVSTDQLLDQMRNKSSDLTQAVG